MDIRTENLTILFVDIAGFTATTNRQSRAENAALLHTFDRTLLPHIKRFKGRVVKSIGDALLLTFRSPTDSMLCAMAMQDAMHATNLNVPDAEKIHIRIAASLGEVRVTPKDIFGEPVNVASRIEGIAPADEIYLSEAVFMAMNKAEVPAQEVGFKELAGLPQAIRIYSIPRFATHRLIPQNAVPEQGGELLYPYGGMHERAPQGNQTTNKLTSPFRSLNKKIAAGIAALIAVVIGTVWAVQGRQPQSPAAPVINNQAAIATVSAPANAPDTAAPPSKSEATSASATSSPASASAKPKAQPEIAKTETIKPAAPKRVQPANGQWTVTTAKNALRADRISKAEYKSIVRKLEGDYKRKITTLKSQYKGQQISRAEYDREVKAAKRDYVGN
ncbi:MAG: adenylate/guanylate cyclase domain-containing protein [Burkholderiaceae bacterium]